MTLTDNVCIVFLYLDKTSAVANASHQEEEFCERYVNIKAKYITDGMVSKTAIILTEKLGAHCCLCRAL